MSGAVPLLPFVDKNNPTVALLRNVYMHARSSTRRSDAQTELACFRKKNFLANSFLSASCPNDSKFQLSLTLYKFVRSRKILPRPPTSLLRLTEDQV